MHILVDAPLSAAMVALVLSGGAICRRNSLEGKIAVARRMLVMLAAALVLTAVGLVATPRTPLPVGELADHPKLLAMIEAQRDSAWVLQFAVASALALLAMFAGVLWLLLRPVGQFVLEQRLDLAARQQIHEHAAASPQHA